MTLSPLRLVIFDCDGVLVDSEGVSARVTAREVSRLGWPLTPDEALQRFIGMRLSDMPSLIEAQTGSPVPPGWVAHVCDRLMEALANEVEAMPGVIDLVHAIIALKLPYRVASNSSHAEMTVKFARTGLTALMAGRQHSAADVGAGKPAPDVFLAAAAAEGVPPSACIVIEDSVPGARAARAAGMACIGLSPHSVGDLLRAEGAQPVRTLGAALPLIRDAMRRAA